jgi:hypothetical protein
MRSKASAEWLPPWHEELGLAAKAGKRPSMVGSEGPPFRKPKLQMRPFAIRYSIAHRFQSLVLPAC